MSSSETSDAESEAVSPACWTCGYDLRQQSSVDDRCPECGTPLEVTLRHTQQFAYHGNAVSARFACTLTLLPIVAFVVVYAVLIVSAVYFQFAAAFDWTLVIVAVAMVSLACAVSWIGAARVIRRQPDPDSGNVWFIALLFDATVVLVVLAITWALVGLAASGASFLDFEVGAMFLAFTLGISAMLFPPLFLGRLRFRVAMWPSAGALRRLCTLALWPMSIVQAVLWTVTITRTIAEYNGWDPYLTRPDFNGMAFTPGTFKPIVVASDIAIGASAITYALCLLIWIGLVITVIATHGRRLEQWQRAQAVMTQRTPSAGRLSTASSAETAVSGESFEGPPSPASSP